MHRPLHYLLLQHRASDARAGSRRVSHTAPGEPHPSFLYLSLLLSHSFLSLSSLFYLVLSLCCPFTHFSIWCIFKGSHSAFISASNLCLYLVLYFCALFLLTNLRARIRIGHTIGQHHTALNGTTSGSLIVPTSPVMDCRSPAKSTNPLILNIQRGQSLFNSTT